MNKDKDLPLQEFKNFVNGPSNKNLFVLKENGKEYRAINDNNKSCTYSISIGCSRINDIFSY